MVSKLAPVRTDRLRRPAAQLARWLAEPPAAQNKGA